MAVANFNTSNDTFRKVMGNGLVYRVPTFQRDYSWEEQEWDDLWQDITAMLGPGGEDGHYMGYLVLQSVDQRRFDVVDGQQRLTTLSILVLAVLANIRRLVEAGIEPEDNQRRIEELRKTYVGFVDPVTLTVQAKLTLNRHDDPYFRTYLVPLVPLPRRRLRASEALLRRAFEWFDDRVRSHFAARGGAALAQFLDAVADRLFFTVISVTDELNAFKVFETLNARGVRLSSTDLLKNHLFSIVHGAGVHETELRDLEDLWDRMLGKLSGASVPDFLRTHWNSRHALTRQADLFKTIRGHVRDRAAVFALVREMDRDADVYAALRDPNDPLWSPDQAKLVGALDLFGVRQPHVTLLAARRVLDEVEFTRVLRACVVLSLRYNVIGNRTPTEQERVYNDVAARVSAGEFGRAADIIRALRPIYLNDDEFRSAFADKQIRTTTSRNRKVVRYILQEIEQQVSGNAYDPKSSKFGIEHVLPEHAEDGWSQLTAEEQERSIHRLGNLTLLPSSINRGLGNATYTEKRSTYAESDFVITRNIAEYDEWDETAIAERQRWLASQACSVWHLSELA